MFGTAIKKVFRKQTDRPTDEITVLYGSHSGNSEFIAKEAQNYLKKNGLSANACNVAKYDIQRLGTEQFVLVVISTHGEGDPPDSALKFYKNLFSEHAPSLTNLQFAVCALGDSSYEQFCKTGKDIDLRLEELGAHRIHNRVDCDLEFHQAASNWVSEVLRKCKTVETEPAPIQIRTENLHQVHQAIIKEKVCLNEVASSETYHVVLSIDSDFRYQPGDSIGIVPQNQEPLVDQILKQLNFCAETTVVYHNETVLLKKLLINKFELTSISKKLIENYQQLAKSTKLASLLTDEKELHDYIRNCDVLDIITDFPLSVSPEDFISVLRTFQARHYSISSSQQKHPREVHLIVKQVQSEQKGRIRSGACSSFLNHSIEPGCQINIRLIPNEQFRIQANGTPMIMIGAGTGIAPFRAFLQEKERVKADGKSWLFFGEKYQQTDFFYKAELERWQQTGLLNHIDLAFSRSQSDKIYVQHKITEQSAEFFDWLNRGAHVYICGSVAMGRDVKQAICRVIQTVGEKTEQEALLYWEKMIDESRIHQDVY